MDIPIFGPVQSKVVDIADNTTTVCDGPCLFVGIQVNTALSAHAVPILDNATAVLTLPASLAAGSERRGWYSEIRTKLVVDPNDVATGNITVFYIPLKQ